MDLLLSDFMSGKHSLFNQKKLIIKFFCYGKSCRQKEEGKTFWKIQWIFWGLLLISKVTNIHDYNKVFFDWEIKNKVKKCRNSIVTQHIKSVSEISC